MILEFGESVNFEFWTTLHTYEILRYIPVLSQPVIGEHHRDSGFVTALNPIT